MRLDLTRVFGIAAASIAAVVTCHAGDEQSRARATERLAMLGAAPTGEGLLQAVSLTHRPIAELQVAAGADVNVRDERGRTPLHLAALAQDWDLAASLLAAGADAARADGNGTTPAMIAAYRGHVPTLRALLGRGAPPSAVDRNRHTALHYAIAARQRAAVDALLLHQPDLTAACCEGCDILAHALETHDWRIVEPILARVQGPLAWTDASGGAALAALAAGDGTMLRALFAKHTSPPLAAAGAQPLVAYAIARGDLTQLQLLLECGVDPNTPLVPVPDAAFAGILGENFMRYHAEREPGLTPLMLAAGLRREECLRMLLQRGATRNAFTQGRSKLIALYFACWATSPECIQLLLDNAPPREQLRVEISLDRQQAVLIQNGVPIVTTAISSGRKGFSTRTGEFVVTDKHRTHRSTLYHDAEMPFFMRLSCGDFGMHQGHVPGRPASHGCIRLPAAAARRLFSEVPVGTWVSIRR